MKTPTLIHPRVAQVNTRLSEIRARFAPNAFLLLPQADDRRGEVFGDDDMPIQSPPYELDAPDEFEPVDTPGTPAGIDYAESVSAVTIAAAADAAHFLVLNIDADRTERDELRAQIARWEAEEHDSHQCGLGGDWSADIEGAADRIDALDERLEAADVAAEIAAEIEAENRDELRAEIEAQRDEETAAERYVREEKERAALPFWVYLAACKGAGESTGTRFQRQTGCTDSQVKFIRFLVGGDEAAREIAGCNLFSLRNAEASALIEWLKSGRPAA